MAMEPDHLMTVDECRQLPEPPGEYTYELHCGELVKVTKPKLKHFVLQSRLRSLLFPMIPKGGFYRDRVSVQTFPGTRHADR